MLVPHHVLRKELIFFWAEEIIAALEEDSVLITTYDPVLATWGRFINELIPGVTIKNTCSRQACTRQCKDCSALTEHFKVGSAKDLCLNIKSTKLLYVKCKEMRYVPVKHLTINKEIIKWFMSDAAVNIVDANEDKIILHPTLYEFIKCVDKLYHNPILIWQMVKYLEFEKANRVPGQYAMEAVLHGLRVSFLSDPIMIESSRLNLYRQNNKV
ncbi:hypothetical protein NEHOM01_1100 [Nematocida homosporus]|uniref:uncharacterized protein n=1 Tax=Nematocida homosporus TaxID=1912981 RepID=UPI00221E87AC|nr:uncharacterized protein NEHOM01_1100 [Nematocida homosporus]KAI5185823.1 hypothetical protein NEHOM01_1100 [Nematocida homosporus]